MMKMALMIAVSLVSVGCGKTDDAARFEKLAERANPVIKKLQPSVAVVLGRNSDSKVVRAACLQAIADAAPLATIKFNDRKGYEEIVGVDDVVSSFSTQQSRVWCKDDATGGSGDEGCVHWCTEMFQALSDGLERVHKAANKEGVEISTFTR